MTKLAKQSKVTKRTWETKVAISKTGKSGINNKRDISDQKAYTDSKSGKIDLRK